MSAKPSGTGLRRGGLMFVLVGVVLFALYHLLRVLDVANIGATGDIGGGMILLLAYALIAVGAIRLLIKLVRDRNSQTPR